MSAAQGRRRRRERVKSVSRVYADANAQKAKEYWDYEALEISWGWVTYLFIVGVCWSLQWDRFIVIGVLSAMEYDEVCF